MNTEQLSSLKEWLEEFHSYVNLIFQKGKLVAFVYEDDDIYVLGFYAYRGDEYSDEHLYYLDAAFVSEEALLSYFGVEDDIDGI